MQNRFFEGTKGTVKNKRGSSGHLVFVYGTLMKGYANDHYMKGAKLIGRGEIVNKYKLYADGIPFAVYKLGNATIKGELYQVSGSILAELDRLEGHPHFYKRIEVPVKVNGEESKAFIYFVQRPRGEEVPSGDYRQYAKSWRVR